MISLTDLAKTHIARDLTDEQLQILASRLDLRLLSDEEIVVDATSAETSLYVIVTGGAKVKGTFGQEVNIIPAGSLIGELSFLDKKPRSATVVSAGDSTVAVITDEIFERLGRDHPEIQSKVVLNIAKVICEKLRSATRMIEALSINYV